jgi:hypothetical protein
MLDQNMLDQNTLLASCSWPKHPSLESTHPCLDKSTDKLIVTTYEGLPMMDRPPQELIDRICDLCRWDEHNNHFYPLEKTPLTVNRAFQHATERTSSRFATFALTASNAERFLTIYSGHRRHLLQHVAFQTIAPPPLGLAQYMENNDDFLPCRDTAQDLQAIDESFSGQIACLFETLKALEDGGKFSHGVIERIKLTIYTPTRTVWEHCIHRRYMCWRVHLLWRDNLHLLFSVNTLIFKENGNNQKYCEAAEVTPFKLDLRVMLDLSAKLPCLESLRCELINEAWTVNCDSEAVRHYTKDWAGPRRDTRWEFSQALSDNYSCLPSSLREIQLDFIDPTTLADGFDQRQVLL